MLEANQDIDALMNERMGLFALDVRDEADTTRIVFVCRVVQTLLRWKSEIVHEATDFELGRRSLFTEQGSSRGGTQRIPARNADGVKGLGGDG
jgi:hypothetical protein